ncbi:hypothetical protein RvY_02166 [Ramazzottius varieornatus]|uniref:Uncharacterized protein n=1 Tax=Ramazzottius varieornatus TaxID=947166 RepID=A0A1D1UQT6_RAMVA|nr:hypothetical protein RvY_02166 [Ramazzottius varieornatus]
MAESVHPAVRHVFPRKDQVSPTGLMGDYSTVVAYKQKVQDATTDNFPFQTKVRSLKGSLPDMKNRWVSHMCYWQSLYE